MSHQPAFLRCDCPRERYTTTLRGVRIDARWYGEEFFVFHTRGCVNRKGR